MSFLFPGMQFKVTYGWSNPSLPFLSTKKAFIFNVATYTINIDVQGQADLSIQGTAFNDSFANFVIGDTGNIEEDGIERSFEKLKKYMDYIKVSVDKEGVFDFGVVQELADETDSSETRARNSFEGEARKRFLKLRKLVDKSKPLGKRNNVPQVTFHELFQTLCEETISAGLGKVFPSASEVELRVIYGDFNENAQFAASNVADFPIHWEKFMSRNRSIGCKRKKIDNHKEFVRFCYF